MSDHTERLPCDSYCEHGGVCVRQRGHAGEHDSEYCKWTDAQAISREAADAICAGNGYPQELLDLEGALRDAAK